MRVWRAHKAKVREMAFSPDGRFLATTAGESKAASVWEAAAGALVGQCWHPANPVRHVAFGPHGHLFTSDERFIHVWTPDTFAHVGWLKMGDRTSFFPHIGGLGVHPIDGRLVVNLSGRWLVWNDPTQATDAGLKYDAEVKLSYRRYPTRIGFSAGGGFFGYMQSVFHLHAGVGPAERPTLLADPDGRNGDPTAFGFARDDSKVAVAFGRRVGVWTLPDDDPVVLRGHTGLVRAVGFHPSGEVLTAAMDGTVRAWDAITGKELRSHDWGIGKVQAATISADGTLCAAGSADGHVVVWDADG